MPIEEGVHTLVQAIYDDSMLKSMFEDGNKPKSAGESSE